MKVVLSVQDDIELRSFVKDMIKGQVKSVTRKELQDMIKTVVCEKVNAKAQKISINNAIDEYVRTVVRQELEIGRWGDKVLIAMKDEVRKIVSQKFKKFIESGNFIT